MINYTLGIVVYNNRDECHNFISRNLLHLGCKIFVIDNSRGFDKRFYDLENVEYSSNTTNLGFGKAHNIALRRAFELKSDYHFILNTDVALLDLNIFSKMISYAESGNFALLNPMILDAQGEAWKGFEVFPSLKEKFCSFFGKKSDAVYQVDEMEILSGCFLLYNMKYYKTLNGFDERFFLYEEDTDLSYRGSLIANIGVAKEVSIVHEHRKGSSRNFRLFAFHLHSLFKLYMKWPKKIL